MKLKVINHMEGKVVLIIVKPLVDPSEITEPLLEQICRKFGKLRKLSIFCRNPAIKAFAEFESSSNAANFLNSYANVLLNFGFFSCFPSAKQFVYLDKPLKPSFPEMETKNKIRANKFDSAFLSTQPLPNTLLPPLKADIGKTSLSQFALTPFSPINRSQAQPSKNQEHLIETNGKQCTARYINQSLFLPDKQTPKFATYVGFEIIRMPNGGKNNSLESKLIEILNLNFKSINDKIIINLCCCFGNPEKIWIDEAGEKALVLFDKSKGAHNVFTFLEGQTFFAATLKIQIVPEMFINQLSDGRALHDFRAISNLSAHHRYKKNLKIRFNQPSKVLHVTNLSPNLDHVVLYHLTGLMHEPKKIIKLAQKSVNSGTMMLVEFNTIQQSFEVLVVLHSKIIDGKSLRLSFSQRTGL